MKWLRQMVGPHHRVTIKLKNANRSTNRIHLQCQQKDRVTQHEEIHSIVYYLQPIRKILKYSMKIQLVHQKNEYYDYLVNGIQNYIQDHCRYIYMNLLLRTMLQGKC